MKYEGVLTSVHTMVSVRRMAPANVMWGGGAMIVARKCVLSIVQVMANVEKECVNVNIHLQV